MNWFRKLFKSSAERAAELAAYEAEVRARIEMENKEAERLRNEIQAQLLEEKMASPTPWFEPIIGSDVSDPTSLRYRWNDAFINDLRKKGYLGESDVEVFEAFLSRQDEIERQRILDEDRELKRNSSEPWVEVMSDKIDSDGRIEIQLDWNPAFIHYLRMNGFRGANEEVMVQAWLAAIEKENNPEEFH